MKHPHSHQITHSRRGGAVIIVVLSLMATLVFLGLFFFNWTSQEVANAELFADPDVSGYKIDPNPIFDQAAEQLIVGTRTQDVNSALWGGVYSMLAQQLGRIDGDTLAPVDWNIGTGQGVQMVVSSDPNDIAGPDDVRFRFVDADDPSNPTASYERTYENVRWNYSQLGHPSGLLAPNIRPNVDYTYPDHNSMFLAHEEETPINLLNTNSETRRILIPSFFRPQLFPQYRGYVEDPDTSTDPNRSYYNLYHHADHVGQVFRPHRQHVYPGTMPPVPRYLSVDGVMAQSGDTTRNLGVFPFPQNDSQAYLGIFSSQLTGADNALLIPGSTILDVDLDGDGKNDSIYLDLDLPLIRLPSGDEYLPMASFKVTDADGLLNLNVHGNRQGADKLGRNLDGDEPISVSNLGMSRSEVNPLWALSQNLTSGDTDRHSLRNVRDRYNLGNDVRPNPMQLANLEFEMLLSGWAPKSANYDPVQGRYGDRTLVMSSQNPAATSDDLPAVAGLIREDLDGDNNRYGKTARFRRFQDAAAGINVPGFVHPLSPVGLGLRPFGDDDFGYLSDSAAGGDYIQPGQGAQRKLKKVTQDPNDAMNALRSPMRWPAYQGFLSTQEMPRELQDPEYNDDYLQRLLLNEEDESIVDQTHNYYGVYDLPFSPSENAALHLQTADLAKAKVQSRVGTLALANLGASDNPVQDKVRRRFTTESWDRLEANFPIAANRLDDEFGTGSTREFPPPAADPLTDPFRPELRDLLRLTLNKSYNLRQRPQRPLGQFRDILRHRLNLNGILVRADAGRETNPAAGVQDVNPFYRDLVPHPTEFTGPNTGHADLPMHHNNSPAPVDFDLVNTDPYAQEWWARYDRQRLARDIYCLLWVLGRGEDINGDVQDPSPEQAREMAQFAVNVVDAMDRDNVVTRFEFDDDLSDGRWDIPTSGGVVNPANVVYGIEEQKLVFSEWLWLQTTPGSGGDAEATLHNEYDGPHQFFYLELRNTSPYPVQLNNETWRIVRYDGLGNSLGTQFNAIAFSGNGVNIVQPGGTFTVACHDGTVRNGAASPVSIGSAIYVRKNGTTGDRLVPVIPRVEDESEASVEDNNAAPEPLFDLDISHSTHSDRFVREDASKTLVDVTAPVDCTIILQRRKGTAWSDLTQGSTDRQEEWIEVDRIEIRPGTEFNHQVIVNSTDDPTQIEAAYHPVLSQEREYPFSRTAKPNPWKDTDPGLPVVRHSIRDTSHSLKNVANDNFRGVPTGDDNRSYNQWQPHFDRDLSSAMELLSIPLYGYRSHGGLDFRPMLNGGPVGNLFTEESRLAGTRTAQIRFLNPAGGPFDEEHALYDDDAPSVSLPNGIPPYNNRWYRLLEFVDVKSQNQLFSDAITAVQRKTPGKVNLNTIRHPSVLAGLIDDPYHINPRTEIGSGFTEFITKDRIDDNERHWYFEHRVHRDGFDHVMHGIGLGNLMIPGGFDAKPFRSLAYGGASVNETEPEALQSTILRERNRAKLAAQVDMAYALPAVFGHGLYEARSLDDIGEDAVDYHTKNRILAKIANNSTTRSHVFIVWMGIDLFKAHKTSGGHIQVGAKPSEDELPVSSYRMFCVVDMSRLEEAYNPINGTFDFRKFIIHRQLLP